MTTVIHATRQHAKNLATYVTIYKTAMYALKRANNGKERNLDSFLSGLLGGYIVFGENNNINQQIVLYVFARVSVAFVKMLASPASSSLPESPMAVDIKHRAWPLFACLSWATVMWLFRWHPDAIQPSMRASMTYLYMQSDKWDGIRNFLIHNK